MAESGDKTAGIDFEEALRLFVGIHFNVLVGELLVL